MSDPIVIIEPTTIDTVVMIQENQSLNIGINAVTIDTVSINAGIINTVTMSQILPDNIIVKCCDDGSGGGGTGFVSQAEWLVIEKIAGEPISGYNLVRFLDSDTIVKATNNDTYNHSKVFGIAMNGGLTGSLIRILIFGVINDPFFSFPDDTLLFLGVDGTITGVPPITGFSTIIGECPVTGVFSLTIREPKVL